MTAPVEAPPCETIDPGPPASSLDQAFSAMLEPICTSLGRIERALDGQYRTSIDDPLPRDDELLRQPAPPFADAAAAQILQRFEALQATLEKLQEQIDLVFDRASNQPVLDDQLPPEDLPDQRDVWSHVLMGDLAADPELAGTREELLREILAGDAAARILAGQLMIVSSASYDDLPEMLRHVGEAFYRWRPRSASVPEDPMERALANWLNRLAEKAGLPNSIQLVQPGERFDSTRHIATGRGVEVVAVQGWVVLRDRNRVYTRANVTVR